MRYAHTLIRLVPAGGRLVIHRFALAGGWQMAPNKPTFYRISRSGIAVIRKGEVGGAGLSKTGR